MAATTFERLAALVAQQHAIDPSLLHPDTDLADAGLDSLAVAELLFTLQDEFGVDASTFPAGNAPLTMSDVVALIDAQHLSAARAAFGSTGPAGLRMM